VKPIRYIIPLDAGPVTVDGPALQVDVDTELVIRVYSRAAATESLPALSPMVACRLGQALLDASARAGTERARRDRSRSRR
jgi:hypothetical protein